MVSRHIRSRVGEVVEGTLLLGMLAYYVVFAFQRRNVLELWQWWQLTLVALSWLIGVAWAFRMLIGPPHYHPEGEEPYSKLRVAHVDLNTGEVVKRELLTPRQVRKRFFRQ